MGYYFGQIENQGTQLLLGLWSAGSLCRSVSSALLNSMLSVRRYTGAEENVCFVLCTGEKVSGIHNSGKQVKNREAL